MKTTLVRFAPSVLLWVVVAFSIAMDRALVGAPGGWSVSIILLPAAWILGLRYGRGREGVNSSILILMAVSEISSPLLPGASAFCVAVIALAGMWVGIRWTSIRLWWFQALLGASTSLLLSLIARLLRSPLAITSDMWMSTLAAIPLTIIVYGIWMLVYARKRWYHEPF